jgi:hypothetical protein
MRNINNVHAVGYMQERVIYMMGLNSRFTIDMRFYNKRGL